MAHNLTINAQGEAEMFSGKNMTPWHKLGQVVAGLLSAKEAIKAAKLDWEVEKTKVFANNKEVPDYFAIARKDNGLVLSILGNRYCPIQNHEAFEFFDEVIGSGQAVYDTAGSLAGGKRVWIMAELEGKLFVDTRPNDTIKKNVLLSTTHDGSGALQMQIVSTRVVCQNTLSVALAGATNQIKIRHSKNYATKKEDAMLALKLCNAYFSDLQAVINELDKQAFNKGEMVNFAEKLLPSTKEEESTRTNNNRQEIVDLFSRGKGNLGVSRWDAMNAVSEFCDHNRGTRTKAGGNPEETRFNSSMFGSGANLKNKAFALLTA